MKVTRQHGGFSICPSSWFCLEKPATGCKRSANRSLIPAEILADTAALRKENTFLSEVGTRAMKVTFQVDAQEAITFYVLRL